MGVACKPKLLARGVDAVIPAALLATAKVACHYDPIRAGHAAALGPCRCVWADGLRLEQFGHATRPRTSASRLSSLVRPHAEHSAVQRLPRLSRAMTRQAPYVGARIDSGENGMAL